MDWQREEISFKLFRLSRLGVLLRGETIGTLDHVRFSMLTKQISKILTVLKALRSRGKNVVDPVEEEGYDD
jgi:hypothetical protein